MCGAIKLKATGLQPNVDYTLLFSVADPLTIATGDRIIYYAACRQLGDGHMAWCSPIFFTGA